MTDKEWRKTRHAADTTIEHLSSLTVIYTVGSPQLKSVVRFSSSETYLVLSGLVWFDVSPAPLQGSCYIGCP
jgi:hypothetical protein